MQDPQEETKDTKAKAWSGFSKQETYPGSRVWHWKQETVKEMCCLRGVWMVERE